MTFQADLQHAIALHNAGQFSDAMKLYTRLYAKNKKNPDLMVRMAITALSLGDYGKTRNFARGAMKFNPKAGVVHNLLGMAELKEGNLTRAVSHFEDAVERDPTDAQSRINLAEALNELNRADEAIAHLEEALKHAPDFPKIHYSLAVIYKGIGKRSESESLLRTAVKLNPHYADAWKSLAYMGETDLETDLPAIKKAAEALHASPYEQAKVLFALFATYEKAEQYGLAFEALETGNKLISELAPYDVGEDETRIREIIALFQPDLFQRFEVAGDSPEEPIFIVGMPRSGTTLVEQILGGHSQVHPCGELNALENAIVKRGERPGSHYPQVVGKWKKHDIKSIRNEYLDALRGLEIETPRFTDKMPENFLFLGVVRILFPKAKIIHCMRNPVDTCLANYRQMLSGHHPQTYSQESLVRYYKAYQALMDHWRVVMGDMILDMVYEKLIDDPEAQAKRLLAFCDLTWETDCLDFTNHTRAVRTASADQVREGVHKGFVERWRRYEPYIKTMIDGL